MSKKTVLLIDGDVLVYQIGLAAERPIDWGDGLWTLHADFNECRETLISRVETLIETLGAEEVRFALSCPTESGYRRELCPTYKLNRKETRKPVIHAPLRQYLLDNHDTILRPRLEADDILGILATQPTDERRILVSIDKDFHGVPCLFYRTNSDNPEVVEVSPESAQRFHAIQTLMGDRVDGYQGIPGVGQKTAEKILADVNPAAFWPTIKKAYADAGLSENIALLNARMARILQHGDYNTETGDIKLWTPSTPPTTRKPTKLPRPPTTSAATKT